MWKLWSYLALTLKASVLSGWQQEFMVHTYKIMNSWCQYGEIQSLFLYYRIRHWAPFGYCCKNHSLIQLTKHWFSNQAQRHFINCFGLICMKSVSLSFLYLTYCWFYHFVICFKFCYNSKLHFYTSFSFNWRHLIFLASGVVVQITEVLI